MTEPQLPSLADVTGVLLADGWHVVAGQSLVVISAPEWPSTQGIPITLGPFVAFVDDHGVQHAFPYEPRVAFRWSAPPAPRPVVTGVSPSTGPTGTQVTVTGSGFTGASAVNFSGVPASFTVVSDTELSATSPAGGSSGTYDVEVVGPGGSSKP